jgi:hypothetical protein
VVSDDVDPIHPCDLIQVMKDARGALDARHYNTFAAELQNATNIACELISAARIALSNLERNLHSEEACGSPFMGDDDHAAIAILRNVLKRCDPEKAALSTLQSGAEGKDGWIAFADGWPNESAALDDPSVKTTDRVLVTNSLHSRDRMGRMSHVWLLSPIQADGEVVGFTESDRKVHALTHWKAVLDTALQPGQGA